MQAAQTSSIFLVSRFAAGCATTHSKRRTKIRLPPLAVKPSPQPSILFDSQWIKSRWDAHCYHDRFICLGCLPSSVEFCVSPCSRTSYLLIYPTPPRRIYSTEERHEDEEAALSQLLTKPSAKTTGNKGNLSHYLCRYAYGQLSPPIGVALPGISSSDTTKLCVTCRLCTKCGQSDAPPEGSVCTTTRDGCNSASQRSIFIIASFDLS